MTIPENTIEYEQPIVMYKDGLKFQCYFEEGDKIYCSYEDEKDFIFIFKKAEMTTEFVEKIDEIMDDDEE